MNKRFFWASNCASIVLSYGIAMVTVHWGLKWQLLALLFYLGSFTMTFRPWERE